MQADYGELLLRDKKGGVKKNEYDQDAFDGLKWLRTGPHKLLVYRALCY